MMVVSAAMSTEACRKGEREASESQSEREKAHAIEVTEREKKRNIL